MTSLPVDPAGSIYCAITAWNGLMPTSFESTAGQHSRSRLTQPQSGRRWAAEQCTVTAVVLCTALQACRPQCHSDRYPEICACRAELALASRHVLHLKHCAQRLPFTCAARHKHGGTSCQSRPLRCAQGKHCGAHCRKELSPGNACASRCLHVQTIQHAHSAAEHLEGCCKPAFGSCAPCCCIATLQQCCSRLDPWVRRACRLIGRRHSRD